jgi:pyridoxamine 5'-phosphate oxidase
VAAPGPDPLAEVRRWLADERGTAEALPFAPAVVATADGRGRPSARSVVLRALDEAGFGFLTDARSRKARELAVNPRAAIVVHLAHPHRQVTAEGPVATAPATRTRAWFEARSRQARLAAWAAQQGAPIPDLDTLARVELWEEGPGELHRRRSFRRAGGGWAVELLAP